MSRYDRPSHRVYMTFFCRSGWQVQFVGADLKTPLPRQFTFKDPEKIRELARRGEAWGDSESRQMLDHAIETGQGGCYLWLMPDPYGNLSHRSLGMDVRFPRILQGQGYLCFIASSILVASSAAFVDCPCLL